MQPTSAFGVKPASVIRSPMSANDPKRPAVGVEGIAATACLMAAREFDALTAPVVSEGVARYKVVTTCVQTSEVVKK